jgi:hypothetical protein
MGRRVRIPKLAWGASLVVLVALGATAGVGLFQQTSWPNEPMPPFEEELYLRIVADWSPEGCVDVVTYTNLPNGTEVRIAGVFRTNNPHGASTMFEMMWVDEEHLFLVHGPRNETRKVLCKLVQPHSRRATTNPGMLIQARVTWISLHRSQEQAERIGDKGLGLRGHLAQRSTLDGVPRVSGYSNTVILEPRP